MAEEILDIYLTEEEVRWLSKYLFPRMTGYKGVPRGWNKKSDLNLKIGTDVLKKLQEAIDAMNANKLGF